MSYKFRLFILCVLLSSMASAQITVKVVDVKKIPIQGVNLLSYSSVYETNSKGEVMVDFFENDTVFQVFHPEYQNRTLTYSQLQISSTIVLEESLTSLPQISISGNNWESSNAEVTKQYDYISRADINFKLPATSADLIGLSPDVYIQKSQQGGGSPMIRGFAANRVLIVVDGIRMNNAIFRSGNLQNVISIDPATVEFAEVLFGPSSDIYGTDAIGGVMYFQTYEPQFSTTDKVLFNANAGIHLSSADRGQKYHADVNIANKKLASYSSFSFMNYNDLWMGTKGNEEYQRIHYVTQINGVDSMVVNANPNQQVSTGFNQYNINQKLRYKPNKYVDVTYDFKYSTTSDIPRYDRLTIYDDNGFLKYAEWNYGPQTWMVNSLQLEYKKGTKWFDEFKLLASYQNFKESRHNRRYKATNIKNNAENLNNYSFYARFKKKFNQQWELQYGADAIYDVLKSKGTKTYTNSNIEEDAGSRYPDGSSSYNIGAYAKVKYHINDKINVNGSFRLNYYHLLSAFDTVVYPFNKAELNQISPSGGLGVVLKLNNQIQIYSNIGTAFRNPNIDDVSKIFDSGDGEIIVPNPNLKSEKAYSFDIGGQFSNEKWEVSASLFNSYLVDAIVTDQGTFNGQDSLVFEGDKSQVLQLQNKDNAIIYGISGIIAYHIKPWMMIKTGGSVMNGTDNEGNTLRHVPPYNAYAEVKYKRKKTSVAFQLNYNAQISAENLAPSEVSKAYLYQLDANGQPYYPSWVNYNVYFQTTLAKRLLVNIACENIADIRYRNYSSGIVAPGRNFTIGLKTFF